MNTFSDEALAGALSRRRNWTIRIAICLVAIVVSAIMGPFSTFERLPFGQRFLYWGGIIGGSLIPAHFVRIAVIRSVSGSGLFRDAVAVIGIGMVLAPVIWWVNVQLLTEELARWSFFLLHLVVIWMICTVPALIRHYYRSYDVPSDPPHAQVASEALLRFQGQDAVEMGPAQPLMRYIDPDKRGPILRVSASDHQLLIFTDKGETRVRLRFSDALAHLRDADGVQVHRSHWVAKVAVARFVQSGRRYSVTLKDGAVVPVSSTRVDEVLMAGFDLEV